MGLTLNKPGEVSGWLGIAAALRKQDKDAADEAVKMLEGVEVRVRTLERRKFLELMSPADELADVDGYAYVIRSEEADVAIMRAGLADIRGIEEGDPEPGKISDDLLLALEATRLHGLISWIIIRFNALRPKERSAFFT